MDTPDFRRIDLLESEYFERVREADDALEAGDHATALRHIRKGLVLEELLDAARNEHLSGRGRRVPPHAHFLKFATFLAVQGDVYSLKKLITVSGHSREPAEKRHAYMGRTVTDVPVYDAIRRAVAEAPGIQQVTLAKTVGAETPYIAELAKDLCNAGELVAANISGRICLWSADSPFVPPAEDRRPTRPWFRNGYVFPRLRSGDEWERLRQDLEGTSENTQVTPGPEGPAVLGQLAGHLDEVAVRGWEKRVSAYVRRVLKDPHFDALPHWSSEDPEEDYFEKAFPELDQETRTGVESQVRTKPSVVRREAEARDEVEQVAARVAEHLPQEVVDQLVFVTRNTDRELLLRNWIDAPTSRRLGWTAYYVHHIVKSRHEGDVLDRYSAAAKTLAARGHTKNDIARALGVSTGRVDRFLERSTWQELTATDPLVAAVPELGEAIEGEPLGGYTPPPVKPKAFSRMTVDERVELAGETDDAVLLERLSKEGTLRVSEALIERHARAGDLSDDILRAVLEHDPSSWIPAQFAAANRERALPTQTALELAKSEPWTLMDASPQTAKQAASVDDDRYRAVLALRNEDVDQLETTLLLDEESPALQILIQLLADRPFTEALTRAPQFIEAVLEASERASEPVVAAVLRLAACRNPDVFEDHVRSAGAAESSKIDPSELVAAALGRSNLPMGESRYDIVSSGENSRRSVREIATKLWSAADLTVEHMLARAIAEERGEESVTIATKHGTFVATADAIRSYPNDETTTYTYVHLHLAAATEYRAGPVVIVAPSSLPALAYHREVGKHPMRPEGDDVDVIVWPLPFQPAIYSLDGIGRTPRYVAASDGKVAFVKNLD